MVPSSLDTRPEAEGVEAIRCGVDALIQHDLKPVDYLLIAATTLYRKPYEGPRVWRLTFKLRSLIPVGIDEELGAGREIFVRVDLATRATVLTYGE